MLYACARLRRDLRGWLAMVQCPHDADPHEHRRAVRLRDQDQRLNCGHPCGMVLLGFWQLCDDESAASLGVRSGFPSGPESDHRGDWTNSCGSRLDWLGPACIRRGRRDRANRSACLTWSRNLFNSDN